MPLLIVHSKILSPIAKPVIVVIGDVAEVIVPLPAISVQTPVPLVGVFPLNVVEGLLIQIV